MLGDAQTVSDEDNERDSRSFDARLGWTTPSSPEGRGLPIAPSWDDGQTAPPAAMVEPNTWEASEQVRAVAPEPGDFADWGGLSSTDSQPLTHDLSAWDSPSDAAVAEAPAALWGLDQAVEAPVWGAEATTTPSVSAWPSLPNPPSSDASAWAPGTLAEPVGAAEPRVEWAADHDLPAAAPPSVASVASELSLTSSWSTPDPEQSPVADWPATVLSAPPIEGASEDESSEDEAPHCADSGVPFHELAAAFAATTQPPVAEPLQAVATATPIAPTAADPSTVAGAPTPKRRGRLAARSAQRNTPTTEVAPETVSLAIPAADAAVHGADESDLLGQIDADEGAPVAVFAPSEVAEAVVETEALPIVESSASEPDADDSTDAAPRRGFFAKRDPQEAAVSPRETPRVLRIAAVVSLLIGLGLFAYSVVTSRSSDTKPTVSTTAPPQVAPSAEAPTTARAPVAPVPAVPADDASIFTDQAPDPIFGSDQTTGSSSVPASAPDADPIFGSDERAPSPSSSADPAPTVNPLFGPPPTAPSPDGAATATDELTFD